MKKGLGTSTLVCGLFLVASVALAQNDDFFVVIAGGKDWKLTGNAGTTPGTHFVGTTDNKALDFRVNNSRALRLEPDATSPNVIGGHTDNSVLAGVYGATISGGGQSGLGQSVSASFATVGGGFGNTASGLSATVGGGYGNRASARAATVGAGLWNTASGDSTTVGGGFGNTASGLSATVDGGDVNTASGRSASVGGGHWNTASGYSATVGGGDTNTASGDYATVGGGFDNTASGYSATVPGGSLCSASGNYSFAGGRRAKATKLGSFVWADSTDENFSSAYDNQFRIRANGGATFVVDSSASEWVRFKVTGGHLIDTSIDAHLTIGGTWTNGSDRNKKENFSSVRGREVLEKLAAVPISTWNYKAEGPSIRHMGPDAQDLYAAFGLGDSEKTIATVDASGLAFAAIQGLYETLKEKDGKIREQEGKISALERRLARLEAIVSRGVKANAMRLSESER